MGNDIHTLFQIALLFVMMTFHDLHTLEHLDRSAISTFLNI